MTARQSRTERRAAEHKARKIARKSGKPLQAGSLTGDPIASPPDEQPQPATRFVSQSIRGVPQPGPTLRAETNRANAQHSTGPRTPEGKLASSRNSLKHGLASAQLIIPGEDPAGFEALLADLLDEHQPANPTEQLLVQAIAQSFGSPSAPFDFKTNVSLPRASTRNGLACSSATRPLTNEPFTKH